jgi:hypothetical protein
MIQVPSPSRFLVAFRLNRYVVVVTAAVAALSCPGSVWFCSCSCLGHVAFVSRFCMLVLRWRRRMLIILIVIETDKLGGNVFAVVGVQ